EAGHPGLTIQGSSMLKGKRPTSLATIAIHGGRGPAAPGDPVVTPLVQSVNYVQEIGSEEGLRYTRYGNVPNAELVQRRLALLDGGEDALILASGMGATACALRALLRPGDHLLASQWIYGGTHRLLYEELLSIGVEITGVNPDTPRDWRR